MNNSKPVSVPLAAHFKLSSASSPDTEEGMEYISRVPYSSDVGSIMYAMGGNTYVTRYVDSDYASDLDRRGSLTCMFSLSGDVLLVGK
ncbi:hypothetical protein Tco_1261516 [Tanacetum coccineum]